MSRSTLFTTGSFVCLNVWVCWHTQPIYCLKNVHTDAAPPLKLRPYGGIEMCILLLLLLVYSWHCIKSPAWTVWTIHVLRVLKLPSYIHVGLLQTNLCIAAVSKELWAVNVRLCHRAGGRWQLRIKWLLCCHSVGWWSPWDPHGAPSVRTLGQRCDFCDMCNWHFKTSTPVVRTGIYPHMAIADCQSPRNTNSLQHWPSPTMWRPVFYSTHGLWLSSQVCHTRLRTVERVIDFSIFDPWVQGHQRGDELMST